MRRKLRLRVPEGGSGAGARGWLRALRVLAAAAAVAAVVATAASERTYEVAFESSEPLGLSLSAELRVTAVARGGSAAATARIATGDVLVAVNGQRVLGMALAEAQRTISRAALPRTLTFARASPGGRGSGSSADGPPAPQARLTGTVGVYRDGARVPNATAVFMLAAFGGPVSCKLPAVPAVIAENTHGCQAHRDGLAMDRVLLVRRGMCSFTDKAILAQQASAVALIVINVDDELDIMTRDPAEAADISLPLVLVPRSHGERFFAYALNPPADATAPIDSSMQPVDNSGIVFQLQMPALACPEPRPLPRKAASPPRGRPSAAVKDGPSKPQPPDDSSAGAGQSGWLPHEFRAGHLLALRDGAGGFAETEAALAAAAAASVEALAVGGAGSCLVVASGQRWRPVPAPDGGFACSVDDGAYSAAWGAGESIAWLARRGGNCTMAEKLAVAASARVPLVLISNDRVEPLVHVAAPAIPLRPPHQLAGGSVNISAVCGLLLPQNGAARLYRALTRQESATVDAEGATAQRSLPLQLALIPDMHVDELWEQLSDFGVPEAWPSNATEVRKLYLRASRRHHPDSHDGDEDRFETLVALYRAARAARGASNLNGEGGSATGSADG